VGKEKTYESLGEETRQRCWRNLLVCGGNVWVASEGGPHSEGRKRAGFTEFSFDVYKEAANDPEFDKWAKLDSDRLNKLYEGTLLYDEAEQRKFVYRLQEFVMSNPEHPQIDKFITLLHRSQSARIKLMDRTQPIAERMKRVFSGGDQTDYSNTELEIIPKEASNGSTSNDSN